MLLQEMGFSWEEAGEALKEHGSLEEALEALFVGGAEPGTHSLLTHSSLTPHSLLTPPPAPGGPDLFSSSEEGSCREEEEQEEEEQPEEEEQEEEEEEGWTVLGRSRPHQARRRRNVASPKPANTNTNTNR